jgi:hypothetical protein
MDNSFKALYEGDIEALQSIPFLTKGTFHVYYQAVFEALNSFTTISPTEEASMATAHISKVVTLFSKLVDYVKLFDHKQVLLITMKQGKKFVDGFTASTIKHLAANFKNSTEEVVATLKQLQTGTRTLQVH